MAKKKDKLNGANDDDEVSSSSSSSPSKSDEPPSPKSREQDGSYPPPSKSSQDTKNDSNKDPPDKDPDVSIDSVNDYDSDPRTPKSPPPKKPPPKPPLPGSNVDPPPQPEPSPPPPIQRPRPPYSLPLQPPPQQPQQPQPPPSPPPPLRKGSPPPPASRGSLPSPTDFSTGNSGNSPSKSAPASGIRGSGGGDSSDAKSSAAEAAKYVGFTLAGVAIVAFVVVVVFTYRRKKAKGYAYGGGAGGAGGAPFIPPPDLKFRMKPGIYHGQQPGAANGPQSPRGNNFGSMKNLGGGSMKYVGVPLDTGQPVSAQIAFSYDMLMEITNSFSSQNIVGQGGFGFVYKGFLHDGRAVAVKQLKAGSGQGEREFRAEVEIISRVHHRHLVSLVGYCIAEQHRMLIYEYVPNGTLHHHLHGKGMPVLDWAKRLKVAIGAAKGLAYLHEDCSQKIIHRDIKSANILLDDAFEAQVADFGLARLTDTDNTHVSTRVMGTFGYMAPEYANSGKLTDRSDVFSFGVVLLELVTGRKPVDETQPLGDESLVEWARPLLLHAIETRDFSELIDPRLENQYVESEMFRMIEAAAACVRHSSPKRPRMVQVVRALDSGEEVSDLSNGVKYGQSTIYNSSQYDQDIMMFRRMVNRSLVESDSETYSRDYLSRETQASQHTWMPSSSSTESESKAFNTQKQY